MGSSSVKPSVAVADLLRRKRQELGLTLREVSARIAEHSDTIPPSTLARIEHGQLDPGVRRLHLLLRLYRLPPHLVADLVELETLAVTPPRVEGDLETLYKEGIDHWKKGNLPQGLAHLFAVREQITDDPDSRLLRQKATLSFAIMARNLGKYRLAKQIVEDLLCEPPDPSLTVKIFVLGSSVWLGLGAPDAAVAFVQYAADRLQLDKPGDVAWIRHQEARVLFEAGRTQEASEALGEALAHYRHLDDTYGLLRAELLRAHLLESDGRLEEAEESARQVIDLAGQHGHDYLVLAGRLRCGRVLVLSGRIEDGLAVLRECLGLAILHGDHNAEFHAHYELWKAYDALGDRERAELELRSAIHQVQHIDEVTREVNEIRAMRGE